MQNSHEAYRLEVDRGQLIVRAFGRWNLHTVKTIDKALKSDLTALGYGHIDGGYGERDDYDQVVFCFDGLERMDTAGAYVLTRAIGCHDGFCRRWKVQNATKGQRVWSLLPRKPRKAWLCCRPSLGMIR